MKKGARTGLFNGAICTKKAAFLMPNLNFFGQIRCKSNTHFGWEQMQCNRI